MNFHKINESRYSPLFDVSSLEDGDVVALGIRTSSDELGQIFKLAITHRLTSVR